MIYIYVYVWVFFIDSCFILYNQDKITINKISIMTVWSCFNFSVKNKNTFTSQPKNV